MDEVAHRSDLSYRDIFRDYLGPGKPVVLTDAVDHWPARAKWSFDYLAEHYGDAEIDAEGNPMSFAELIRAVQLPDCDPTLYMRNNIIENISKAMIDDIRPRPIIAGNDWLNHPLVARSWAAPVHGREEMHVGPIDAGFRLHKDEMGSHALVINLIGAKEVILYSPDQEPLMYPSAEDPELSQIPDPTAPDSERFPNHANAVPIRAILREGDTCFIPAGWWHYTRVLEPCVTVGINFFNMSNWPLFCENVYAVSWRPRTKAKMLRAYLSTIGSILTIRDRMI